MDGFELTREGVARLENRRFKERLGFDTVQAFVAGIFNPALAATAPVPDDCEALGH